MHTYLLSDDTVRRYGLDFVERLEALDTQAPKTWFTLGISGDKIADLLIAEAPGSPGLPGQGIVRIAFDRATEKVSVRDGGQMPTLGEEPILVIDAAIHSGSSMRYAVEHLMQAGAKNIASYSLIVKKTTEFVPNYFGMVIEEHDRVFFQLDKLPNNRLRTKPPFGSLRLLREDDIHRDPDHINCGVPSINKITFGDLWYDVCTKHSQVYLYEVGNRIVGVLHFKYQNGKSLILDLIAADNTMIGSGIGSILMRWAETFARSSRCTAIELWAIANRVQWYQTHGFQQMPDPPMNLGGGEVYQKMSRRILYNVKPGELTEA